MSFVTQVSAAVQLYLIDTSVWIFGLRRNAPAAVTRRISDLLQLDAVATCGLIELELLGGTRDEPEFDRLRSRLKGLHYLPTEPVDWTGAARLAYDLRRLGVTVPYTDALLAAVARRSGAIIVHADRDFDLIAAHSGLDVESLVEVIDT